MIDSDLAAILHALASSARGRLDPTALSEATQLSVERVGEAVELAASRGFVTVLRAATARPFLMAEITAAGREAAERQPSRVERIVVREKTRRGTVWALIAFLILLGIALAQLVF